MQIGNQYKVETHIMKKIDKNTKIAINHFFFLKLELNRNKY